MDPTESPAVPMSSPREPWVRSLERAFAEDLSPSPLPFASGGSTRRCPWASRKSGAYRPACRRFIAKAGRTARV